MLASLILLLALLSPGQEQGQRRGQFQGQTPTPQTTTQTPTPAAQGGGQQGRPQAQPTPTPEEPPVVTKHSIRVGGNTINYTATAGLMPIKNREGEVEARMFFTSYVVDRADGAPRRPLTFSFNGGPGSASVWLHMGAIGPKRVKMNPDGTMPSPPYELVDNEATWLSQSDLVFIDPVGTGYSRPAKKENEKNFWGLKGKNPCTRSIKYNSNIETALNSSIGIAYSVQRISWFSSTPVTR